VDARLPRPQRLASSSCDGGRAIAMLRHWRAGPPPQLLSHHISYLYCIKKFPTKEDI